MHVVRNAIDSAAGCTCTETIARNQHSSHDGNKTSVVLLFVVYIVVSAQVTAKSFSVPTAAKDVLIAVVTS